jgi:hypothetical protein
MNTIDDFKLELKALQQKDTENANNMGYKTKREWFEYIMKEKDDEIAKAIMDLAVRYNVPLNTVAYNFDPTMVMRVGKLIKQEQKEAIKKQ